MKKRSKAGWLLPLFFMVQWGCAPAVVGGGAAGGYKVATDERSAGRLVDDSMITAKVKAQMIAAKEVKARNIDVDTLDGVVILSGFVDSAAERSRAAEVARTVEGVVAVTNDLQVGTRTVGQAMDDTVLGSKIKGKFVEEPDIRSWNIDVDVYLGIVSLKGMVPTSDQKKAVLEMVRQMEGVKGIVDHLKVR